MENTGEHSEDMEEEPGNIHLSAASSYFRAKFTSRLQENESDLVELPSLKSKGSNFLESSLNASNCLALESLAIQEHGLFI